jgi:hypothetical protein
MQHDHDQRNLHKRRKSSVAARIAWVGFAASAGLYLLLEHRVHVAFYLPYLLLVACPLLHLFHHGGHGHKHGKHTKEDAPPRV